MSEMKMKQPFLDLIRSTHIQLEASLKDLTPRELASSVCNGEWSIKDIIAHIAWYEAEMVKVLETRSLHGSDWWDLPLDKRNELIHHAYQTETPGSVIENENKTYQNMINLLKLLSEEDLNDPVAFEGMPGDWKPWSVIASNTYEHYPEHIRQIKDCLKS